MLKRQDNRKTMSPCHRENEKLLGQRNDTGVTWQQIPFQSKLRWHRYTCNWYPKDIERLDKYCKESSNSVSWRTTEFSCWMEWLRCHICKCAEWYETDSKWWCCLKWNTDKSWVCCSEWTSPNSDWICAEKPTETQTIVGSQTWWQLWTQGQTQEGQNEENNENKCPPQLQDSKWNCCKKMYYDVGLKKDVCCE